MPSLLHVKPDSVASTPTNDDTTASASEEITSGILYYLQNQCLAPPQEHLAAWPSSHSTLDHESSGFTTDVDNCCVLVTGLPSTVTVPGFIHEIQVRRLGKIAAVSVKPALPFVPSAAVKVTMWNKEGADRIMHAVRTGNFGFEGHSLRAYWNRVKVPPQQRNERSRVMKVRGHPDKVAPSVLLPWFASKFDFDIDQVHVNRSTPKDMVVEYRFGSYLNQSFHAVMLVRNTYHRKEVSCVWLKDPCEPTGNEPTRHGSISNSEATSPQPDWTNQQQVSALPIDTHSEKP
ncbi:hypothetical protein PG993_010885 [Apiospora rasikravindrae]|uniref:Uncharacterized protein n=1 Tax=Apiospora rasikravindrae TaxID=990691 RepID=A0ABR1SED7_9PEZI